MKSSITSFVLGSLLVSVTLHASAVCNTVMGGCVREEAVNVAPHMKADNNKKISALANKPALGKPINKSNSHAIATNQTKQTPKKI